MGVAGEIPKPKKSPGTGATEYVHTVKSLSRSKCKRQQIRSAFVSPHQLTSAWKGRKPELSDLKERFLIRAVEPADFENWKPLWDGYNAFYGRKNETALPQEITARTWARFFDTNEPMHALVADQEGRLLGLVHYIFHRSTISLTMNCYLQDLFTVESARGQGVGRALIEEVYRRAQTAGSSRVYWHTHGTNATAMQLYDKVAENSGFVVYRKVLG
jgi:GNAT superfamily N-acetyltransferase